MKYDVVHQELEDLTGKLFKGDITPIVFDILKDTADVKGLLKYLNVVVEEENKTETKNEQEHPSFESLFNNSPIVNRRQK